MENNNIILVGNVGAGWFPPLPEITVNPESGGSRKLAAIKAHREATNSSYSVALAAVEAANPEFRGRYIDQHAPPLGDGK